MATVKVNPGVCGLKTTIKVDSEDMQIAKVEISSECSHVMAMGKLLAEIEELDAFSECFVKLGDGEIYKAANKACKHAACPVPSAVVKALEVACGLALPADVSFEITRN
ncbi:MAG: hypothetical protein Q7J78_02220 [Clostridiales bacterium]|nr:hypothetical protein [Clostridiales bacterium]